MRHSKSRACSVLLAAYLGTGCATDGGMDGAGSFVAGLDLGQQVFVQSVWQDGELSYLVMNERTEDIELTLRDRTCIEYRCDVSTQPVLVTWPVPARSTRRFGGEEVLGAPGIIVVQVGPDTLGIIPPPHAPGLAPLLPIVSNSATFTGLVNDIAQVESSVVALTGSSLTLVLVLPNPMGQLKLPAHQAAAEIPILDVVDVRSEQIAVQRIGDDFVLDVQNSNSDTVRVEVDVAVPADAADRLVVGFSAVRCVQGTFPDCEWGVNPITRIFARGE
jgi:hypothetical protein